MPHDYRAIHDNAALTILNFHPQQLTEIGAAHPRVGGLLVERDMVA